MVEKHCNLTSNLKIADFDCNPTFVTQALWFAYLQSFCSHGGVLWLGTWQNYVGDEGL